MQGITLLNHTWMACREKVNTIMMQASHVLALNCSSSGTTAGEMCIVSTMTELALFNGTFITVICFGSQVMINVVF